MFARRIISVLLPAALACAAFAAPMPRGAAALRDRFEDGMRRTEALAESSRGSLGMEYMESLRSLQLDMQTQGRVRAMVTIFDEMARYSRTHAAPTNAIADPPELQALQKDYSARFQRQQFTNEAGIVALAASYLQALAGAREKFGSQGDIPALKLLDDERDRVLVLPRIREALAATRERPPPDTTPPAGSAAALAAGTTNVILKDVRDVRMYRMSGEDVRTVMGYAISVEIGEDQSKLKERSSASSGGKVTTTDGNVTYVPKITINCRNAELPADCRMVIEYFGHSITERTHSREGVETIPLPALARGAVHTYTAKGVSLYRFEQVSVTTRGQMTKTIQGNDFFGLIVNIFDADNQPVVQRFAPQSLAKEVMQPAAEKK